MQAQLIIALEAETIEQAAHNAAQAGQDLPTLLVAYVKQLAHPKRPLPPLPPEIQALRGIVTLPEGVDYQQVVAEEITRKYSA